ncbi:MAG: cytochrome c biogenesis protein ResB [Candidatus Sumerlaeota bacterium]|nr:cytochrome c biogenesis protein ResB [Candidatus Sumerlaeota bacterium]
MDSANPNRLWRTPPWSWLFSLKVGVVLLAVLAAASMIGTAIGPQILPDGKRIAAVERAQRLVFYTWWYETLLALMAINITCATARTLVERILPARRPGFRKAPLFYDSAQPAATVDFAGAIEEAAGAFRRHGFSTATEGPFGYAWKGKLSLWGAPMAHVGAITLLVGGFLAGFVNQEGSVRLREGQQTDTLTLQTEPRRTEPLGFTLRCDDFETRFFPKTNINSTFVTTVTILQNGAPAATDYVEVNHAVTAGGWALHQTGYDEIPGAERYVLEVRRADDPTSVDVELSPGQSRPLPNEHGAEIALGGKSALDWAISQKGQLVAQGKIADLAPEYEFGIVQRKGDPGFSADERTLRLGEAVPLNPATSDEAGSAAEPLELTVVQFEPDFVIGPNHSISSRSRALNNPAVRIARWRFSCGARKSGFGSMRRAGG